MPGSSLERSILPGCLFVIVGLLIQVFVGHPWEVVRYRLVSAAAIGAAMVLVALVWVLGALLINRFSHKVTRDGDSDQDE